MKLTLALLIVFSALAGWSNAYYIVGGTETTIGEHPHQLSLRYNNAFHCGATLISNTKTITAAHCVLNPISGYALLGGTSNRYATKCPTCVLFNLTSISIHPGFSMESSLGFPNDIAVITHPYQVFNPNFKAIEVASSGSFVDQECTITGWGRTCWTCFAAEMLQLATVKVITNQECQLDHDAPINEGHVCIKSLNATSSACKGDSGGPLVCNGQLVGATSFGITGCPVKFSNVYTDLSYYYDWINQQ